MAWTDMTQLTGLVAWYKPETLAATYANGDPISTWADSSGNSRDLTGTTTTRPLAAASAINGYMAADFDGTDDRLSSAGFSWTSSMTCFAAVMQRDVDKNHAFGFTLHDSSTSQYPVDIAGLSLISSDGAHWVDGMYTSGRRLAPYDKTQSKIPSTGTPYIYTCGNGSFGPFGRADGNYGVSKATGSISAPANAPSTTAYLHLGFAENVSSSSTTYVFDGKFCELICWSPTSGLDEVPWVEGYLADKYAITLADGHLFKNEPPQNAPTTYNTCLLYTSDAADDASSV